MWCVYSSGCQVPTEPLSLPVLSRTEEENKIKKLMGQDKRSLMKTTTSLALWLSY